MFLRLAFVLAIVYFNSCSAQFENGYQLSDVQTLPLLTPIINSDVFPKKFEIEGTVLPNANAFAIDFRDSAKNSDNINFHFNVRYYENVVVRNNRKNNVWLNEDRSPIPINKGDSFKIEVTIDEKEFSVKVNNALFCTFAHKNPRNDAKFVHIYGDVKLKSLKQSNMQTESDKNTKGVVSFLNPDALPKKIEIEGTIPDNANAFAFDVLNNPKNSEIINFHFNVRYNENVIVRNNRKDNTWANEDRSPIPFNKGQNVKFVLTIDNDKFNVEESGKLICTFSHKNPKSDAKFVMVYGDFNLKSIKQYY